MRVRCIFGLHEHRQDEIETFHLFGLKITWRYRRCLHCHRMFWHEVTAPDGAELSFVKVRRIVLELADRP